MSNQVLFVVSDKHYYRSCAFHLFLILLHVLAVHISHHQVGHWFTKRCEHLKHVVILNKGQIHKIYMVVFIGKQK